MTSSLTCLNLKMLCDETCFLSNSLKSAVNDPLIFPKKEKEEKRKSQVNFDYQIVLHHYAKLPVLVLCSYRVYIKVQS